MLDGVKKRLKGIKTYIVAVAAILTAVGSWLQPLDGISTQQLVTAIFAAIALMTTRDAIG